MRETARALRTLGLSVDEVFGPQAVERMREYDIVHLFNLQTPEFSHGEAVKAKEAGRKLALSTIYWDFGAELLTTQSRIWRRISGFLGHSVALRLAQRRVESVAKADRAQMRSILENADIWLPNSHAEISHLQRLSSMRKPIQVVPNGIDAKRFDPFRRWDLPEWAKERGIGSRDYVLVAARIDVHKNQVPFCLAMQGFHRPVVLIGKAADPALVEECEQAGAIYAGPQSGDELVRAFAHAKVHALPSFRETPGLASLEAAAMGCAIVSTTEGSAEEYLRGEAHYCEPKSLTSMREEVEEAWKQGAPPHLSSRIRDEYTWDAAAQKTLEAYERILGG